MNKLTNEQTIEVELYRRKIRRIDERIAKLETEREEVHNSFEDYAGYCQHYRAYYEDEPLGIREYYETLNQWRELMAEHDAIYAKIDLNDPDVDYSEADEFDKRTGGLFALLERKLAA